MFIKRLIISFLINYLGCFILEKTCFTGGPESNKWELHCRYVCALPSCIILKCEKANLICILVIFNA